MKAARVNANLTQLEASKRLKISKSTLANYEKGVSVPGMKMGEKIAELYGMPVDAIKFF
jgi:transcriptional regulator with XRE-family HTH domain